MIRSLNTLREGDWITSSGIWFQGNKYGPTEHCQWSSFCLQEHLPDDCQFLLMLPLWPMYDVTMQLRIRKVNWFHWQQRHVSQHRMWGHRFRWPRMVHQSWAWTVSQSLARGHTGPLRICFGPFQWGCSNLRQPKSTEMLCISWVRSNKNGALDPGIHYYFMIFHHKEGTCTPVTRNMPQCSECYMSPKVYLMLHVLTALF